MPRRIAAITTEYLICEVAHLDDAVLLLPEQTVILIGLTRPKRRERMRTRPRLPQQPYASLGSNIDRHRRLRRTQCEREEALDGQNVNGMEKVTDEPSLARDKV